MNISDVKAYAISQHFIDPVSVIANRKAIESGFLVAKSSLRSFYDRHHDLVNDYFPRT